MKKITLIAAGSLMALAAQAQQYTVDPSNSVVLDKAPKSLEFLVLSSAAQSQFAAKGATVSNWGPDDVTNYLYVWDQTMNGGDASYPAVDFEESTYPSFIVNNIGWSGAGYFITSENTTMLNDDTRFHIAYMTSGTAPSSIALIIGDGRLVADGAAAGAPAKVAIGESFNDGGAIYPTIGPKANDDWQGIDISFADLKRFYPTFNFVGSETWSGNILSFLAGSVQGTTFAFDVVYFYNLGDEGGIGDAVADNAIDFVITENTVNVNNGKGIVLYNLAGQVVKSTEGCTLGINNIGTGIYIARSGNKAQKVVVK